MDFLSKKSPSVLANNPVMIRLARELSPVEGRLCAFFTVACFEGFADGFVGLEGLIGLVGSTTSGDLFFSYTKVTF